MTPVYTGSVAHDLKDNKEKFHVNCKSDTDNCLAMHLLPFFFHFLRQPQNLKKGPVHFLLAFISGALVYSLQLSTTNKFPLKEHCLLSVDPSIAAI